MNQQFILSGDFTEVMAVAKNSKIGKPINAKRLSGGNFWRVCFEHPGHILYLHRSKTGAYISSNRNSRPGYELADYVWPSTLIDIELELQH
jgi:hypothetical protein